MKFNFKSNFQAYSPESYFQEDPWLVIFVH